jgi:hypothetical protein
MWENRIAFRRQAGAEEQDWVVHADSDQLTDFPSGNAPAFLTTVQEMGYDTVYGYYIGRVAENGILANLSANSFYLGTVSIVVRGVHASCETR